jgi:hypothetical protein
MDSQTLLYLSEPLPDNISLTNSGEDCRPFQTGKAQIANLHGQGNNSGEDK